MAEEKATLAVSFDEDEEEDDEFQGELVLDEGAWGKLVSLQTDFEDVMLIGSCLSFGRSKNCDVVITDNGNISSKHCEIMHDSSTNLVFVTDWSTNGTYINSNLIGKGHRQPIQSHSTLSLLNPQKPQFPAIRYLLRLKEIADDEIHSHYILGRTLGSGNFASVKLGTDRKTSKQYAIKCIEKKKCVGGSSREDAVMDEIRILEQMDHPHIIKIIQHFVTPTTIYLVLELVSGGELFDYIVDQPDGLEEEEAKVMMLQMVDAVTYLHGRDIAHRDIKPENILLANNPQAGAIIIKLSDFGLSRLSGGSIMTTMCGTPNYLAPEVLTNSATGYGKKVDVWSLGVVMYILLCGEHPFDESRGPVLQLIKNGSFSMDQRRWENVSSEAIDLIKKCIVVDPVHRITSQQMSTHPWFTDASDVGQDEDDGDEVVEKTVDFAKLEEESLKRKAETVESSSDIKKKSKSLNDQVRPCKYGLKCYRKNPAHFVEFSHPPGHPKNKGTQ